MWRWTVTSELRFDKNIYYYSSILICSVVGSRFFFFHFISSVAVTVGFIITINYI